MVVSLRIPRTEEERNESKKETMEGDKDTTMICTVIAIDQTDFCYRVCSICEKPLPNNPTSFCDSCNFNSHQHSRSKRLFRVLMSIASDTKVFTVICFDRAVKVLFGCSADEFFDFAKIHPFAVGTVSKILEGEMIKVTVSRPKNMNAQHLRLSQVVPLRSGFQPAIGKLKEFYGVSSGS